MAVSTYTEYPMWLDEAEGVDSLPIWTHTVGNPAQAAGLTADALTQAYEQMQMQMREQGTVTTTGGGGDGWYEVALDPVNNVGWHYGTGYTPEPDPDPVCENFSEWLLKKYNSV